MGGVYIENRSLVTIQVYFNGTNKDEARNLTEAEVQQLREALQLARSQIEDIISQHTSLSLEERVQQLDEGTARWLLILALLHYITPKDLEKATQILLIANPSYSLDALVEQRVWGLVCTETESCIFFPDARQREQLQKALWNRFEAEKSLLLQKLASLFSQKSLLAAYASEAIANMAEEDYSLVEPILCKCSQDHRPQVREVAGITWEQIWRQPTNTDHVSEQMKEWSRQGCLAQKGTLLEFLESLFNTMGEPVERTMLSFAFECLEEIWRQESPLNTELQAPFARCLHGMLRAQATPEVLKRLEAWFPQVDSAPKYEEVLQWNRLLTTLMQMDGYMKMALEGESHAWEFFMPTLCYEVARNAETAKALAKVLGLAMLSDDFLGGLQTTPMSVVRRWLSCFDALSSHNLVRPEGAGASLFALKKGLAVLYKTLSHETPQQRHIEHLRYMNSETAQEIYSLLQQKENSL